MSSAQWWMVGTGAVLLFWAVGAYTRLQAARADIVSAFANLDTQLRRRHELVPRLTQQLRPQQPDAHDALERLLAASNQVMAATQLVKGHPHQSGPIQACNMAEDVFQAAHAGLIERVCEPDEGWLGADVPTLLDDLLIADNQARFARGLFNDTTAAYNDAIHLWPTRALARVLGFAPAASLSLLPSRIDVARVTAPAPLT